MKKILLTRALAAKKKIFVMAFLAVFSSFYTEVWGADSETDTYIWKETPKQLTIKASGFANGVMNDYTTSNQPWNGKLASVKRIIIQEGITTIGKYAFYNAQYLESVILPISLTSIKSNAFYKASSSLSKDDTLHYAGSPSEWASVSIAYKNAHPLQRTGHYFFYGSNSETSNLVLSPTITEVKRLAFYNGTFNNVYIPGTITNIRDSAFRCSISSSIAINRSSAPSLGTNSFMSLKRELYVPTTNSGYTVSPWSSYTKTTQDVSGTMSESIGKDITWDLDVNGTLTLNATGSNKVISIIREAATSYNDYPWVNFRRLVNKVILKGEIEEVKESFTYCFGLNEVELDQTTIPTVTTSGSHATINFSSRFDQRNNVTLKIKSASLTDASVTNLGAEPWSNAKLDIGLNEPALFDQGQNNEALVESINEYIDLPISLQLRSISNAYNNTFCSPVTLTKAQAKAIWGDATEIHRLSSTSIENDKLTLVFSEIGNADMEAGYPYLIWPENNVAAPIVEGVDPSNIEVNGVDDETDYITFHGILEPKTISQGEIDNQSIIFLTGTIVDGKQQLTWANGGTLKGMRAYWKVKEGTPASVMAKRPVLQIGNSENTTTDLGQVPSDKIQCTKVLRDGQIYILRGEKAYNLQGIEIDRPNKL